MSLLLLFRPSSGQWWYDTGRGPDDLDFLDGAKRPKKEKISKQKLIEVATDVLRRKRNKEDEELLLLLLENLEEFDS